jgi:uncharacterized protein YydD (DUF2326 family)
MTVVNGDIYINVLGKTEYIYGIKKMAQDLIQEFLTEYDAETNRGTKIRTVTNVAFMQQEVTETVERLQERQDTNVELSPEETIEEISQVVVETYDNVNVFFYVQVKSLAGTFEDVSLMRDSNGNIIPVSQQLLP